MNERKVAKSLEVIRLILRDMAESTAALENPELAESIRRLHEQVGRIEVCVTSAAELMAHGHIASLDMD